jgi:single-strand DNA-binding protein
MRADTEREMELTAQVGLYRPADFSKEIRNMSGVNQIMIVGNVGSAPELNYGQNSVPFCRFSVAVNEQWKTDGVKKEKVTWFPVIAFNALAETCANFIDRGRLVAIQGRVQTREYDDQAGTKHQVMQVVAEKVVFLGAGKRDERDNEHVSPGQPRGNGQEKQFADEVPF